MEENKKTESAFKKGGKKWAFWLSLGAILIIIYKFLDNFTNIGTWFHKLIGILTPFLVAIVIAYILYLPCKGLENGFKKIKMRHPRLWSMLIVYIVTFTLIGLAFRFVIPVVVTSVIDLVENVQGYYNTMSTTEAPWAPFVQENIIKPAVEYFQQIDFSSFFTPDKIMSYLNSAVVIAKVVLNIFIAIICSIYILAERESIAGFVDRFMKAARSEKGYEHYKRYFSRGNEIFFRFFSSQIIDAIVVSILMSIVLTILNVKYSIALGFMIGIFNLIPYFGAIAAVIIATIITILTGGWKLAIISAIIMIIVQQIDANIINPKITGSRLSVSPLLIVFSVTVGGAYFGIPGMFLAVPVAVLIKVMIEDYVEERNKEKELEKKSEEIVEDEIDNS